MLDNHKDELHYCGICKATTKHTRLEFDKVRCNNCGTNKQRLHALPQPTFETCYMTEATVKRVKERLGEQPNK